MSQSASPEEGMEINSSDKKSEIKKKFLTTLAPPPPPPSIFLNNLNYISTPNKSNGIATNTTTRQPSLTVSTYESEQLDQSSTDRLSSKSQNSLLRRMSHIEVDIEDNDDSVIGSAPDLNGSGSFGRRNSLFYRSIPGSGTSETLKIPAGIFSNSNSRIHSKEILSEEEEMSEEKLLGAMEDEEEARDKVPTGSPRPPLLRYLKPSSAPAAFGGSRTGGGGGGGQGGMVTSNYSNNTSLWMSQDYDDILKHECNVKCSSMLHIAVKTGNLDEVEIQLETSGDPNAMDCFGRTPLHYAVTMGCNCDSCTATAARLTQLLVDSPKTDIDCQDNQGETALHLAAENQATKCASILLSSAADVSIKSKNGVKALTLIVEKIPDALDSLLNRAVTIRQYDFTNVKCELTLDFGALVGYSETRGYSQRKSKFGAGGDANGDPLSGMGNVKARKEMQLLTLILDCSSSARKKILTHPLIAIFLYLKWKCVRTVFWLTILLQVVLLLLYTLYILDVYLISCPYRPKITITGSSSSSNTAENVPESDSDNSTYTDNDEFIKFSWFEFSPQLQELDSIKPSSSSNDTDEAVKDGCPLEIGPTVKSILLLALTILMVTNEVFKMLPAPRSYWKRTNNRLQWTLFFFIFLTSWPVFMSFPNINFWQYQAAAFGLFLAWGLMLSQIGKFPILGLYVEILTKVLKNFGFFMITYASLLMAFALAFCVLFPGNAPYSSIPLAILKVLMMMVGEVNYEDLFYGNEENPVDDLLYPITGHFLYGAFVIMITIVLMNLLVGLTVSDIQGLQKDAELTRLSRQIGEISQLESFVFSKRVQSFLPSSFAAFLRESVLVVRPKEYYEEKFQDKSGPKDFGDSSWNFHLRPNDPNDKSIPEDLKVAVLRIAAARHRTKRTNRCTKNFRRGSVTPTASLLEEYQRYASTHSGASGWLSTPQQQQHPRMYNRRDELTINMPGEGQQRLQVPSVMPPPFASSSRQKLGSGGGRADAIRDPPEYTYFMKRLEEKIMDRMKIQMDALYQKIEDKIMNIP